MVTFKRLTTFLGRNGTAKCSGVQVTPLLKDVILTPITSKDLAGRCEIVIPTESIQEVCTELLSGGRDLFSLVLDNLPQTDLPLLLGLDKNLDQLIAKKLKT